MNNILKKLESRSDSSKLEQTSDNWLKCVHGHTHTGCRRYTIICEMHVRLKHAVVFAIGKAPGEYAVSPVLDRGREPLKDRKKQFDSWFLCATTAKAYLRAMVGVRAS